MDNNILLNIVKKILNHFIVKNILILTFAALIILYGTLVVLRIYTHHGEAISVPDVAGMSLLEAGITLERQNMRWQVSDSVYVATVSPGAVVNQNPEADSKVKRNRNIFLVINAVSPEMVIMPNVVGVSLRQANSTLESQGLYVGRLTRVPHRNEGLVLRQMYRGQEIRRGTEIVKGSEIDLELGGGLSSQTTSVPNLIGNTLPQARNTLRQYVLNFGVILHDNTVITRADSANAFVYQQRPVAAANTMIQLGSIIDLWLTVDETKRSNFSPEIGNE